MSLLLRAIGTAAFAGAAILTCPPPAVAADAPPAVAAAPAATQAPAPRETVEQRIAALHASLQITPDEEAKWNAVARSMRNSAAVMERLMAGRRASDRSGRSAAAELETYEHIAQAHADSLKGLTASFTKLYNAMPGAQKKVADQVFDSFGRRGDPSRG